MSLSKLILINYKEKSEIRIDFFVPLSIRRRDRHLLLGKKYFLLATLGEDDTCALQIYRKPVENEHQTGKLHFKFFPSFIGIRENLLKITHNTEKINSLDLDGNCIKMPIQFLLIERSIKNHDSHQLNMEK